MPTEVAFEGDWEPSDIQSILDRLRDRQSPQLQNDIETLLDYRQRALLKAFSSASEAAIASEECDIDCVMIV